MDAIREQLGFKGSAVDHAERLHATLRKQLDSSKERDKLDAMKQIVSMLSGGEDVSFLFADVVKNVVSKNLEVKKLVYHFLVHYAESQAELALLSINSFQKDLADPNPVIRALALRVLSSIRLPMIVPIVVLSIQKCVADSSPYVRKAAAHAVTKVFAMDPEQRPALREFVATLLQERSHASLGSAVAAFNDVCPDDWDLIHPHYRKLCIMLVDSDEWSQVHIINVLTRYARAHFINPNTAAEEDERIGKRKQKGWDSADEDDEPQQQQQPKKEETLEDLDQLGHMDVDHRMLLTALSPLLNSSSYQVVVAVVAAFYYVAPAAEAQRAGRALVRVLRSPPEVQFVVLCSVVSMAAKRPSMFAQHVSEFFIRGSDPAYLATLKLEVLTHIADSTNIMTILREFHYYTTRDNKELVACAVQAIGRCAANLPKVTDSCMARLLAFLGNPSPVVVAESVIVIKKILQLYPKKYSDAVERLARMLDKVTDHRARSSIVWVIGEHAEDVPLYAPDVLRKLALGFVNEAPEVKVQALNLGVKLHFLNPQQTDALARYVMDVASFDLSYDVRDKARLAHAVLASSGHLGAEARSLFFAQKPAPKFQDPSEGRQRFVLGSLSQTLNAKLPRHLAMPAFPAAINPEAIAVRSTDAYSLSVLAPGGTGAGQQRVLPDAWTDDGWNDDGDDDDDDEDGDDEEGSEESGYASGKEGSWSSDEAPPPTVATPDFDSLFSGSVSSPALAVRAPEPVPASAADQNSLLDSIFSGGSGSVAPATPASAKDFYGASPNNNSNNNNNNGTGNGAGVDTPSEIDADNFYPPSPVKKPLLAASDSGGLVVEYGVVAGKTNQYGEKYSNVELYIRNETAAPIQGINVSDTKGSDMHVFPEIAELPAGASVTAEMFVAFPLSGEAVTFQLGTDEKSFDVTMVLDADE